MRYDIVLEVLVWKENVRVRGASTSVATCSIDKATEVTDFFFFLFWFENKMYDCCQGCFITKELLKNL